MHPVTTTITAGRTPVDELARLHALDLLRAFRLDRGGRLQPLLDALALWPSRRLARQILQFDALVGSTGLPGAGAWLIERFTRSLTISGQQHVPASGPLLVVANHPGMVDAMALWVGVGRRDLRVLAVRRELLNHLPHTSRHLIFIADGEAAWFGAARNAMRHLRAGGALLTYPAGAIEPDPSVRPGARAALERWTPSTSRFARMAPETLVVPALVGGVISASAQRNPLTRWLPTRRERDWAAATLQVLLPRYRDTDTQVRFGPGIPAAQLNELSPAAAQAVIVAQMAALLAPTMHQ
jgi:1-acyl-sn-glycerol-3-phosphate acyltransferase